jgi:hypothetical protein
MIIIRPIKELCLIPYDYNLCYLMCCSLSSLYNLERFSLGHSHIPFVSHFLLVHETTKKDKLVNRKVKLDKNELTLLSMDAQFNIYKS